MIKGNKVRILACLGVLAAAGAIVAFFARSPIHDPLLKERVNVVLIGIDTLNALHLGAYDSERTNSPRIDALAKGGAMFKNTYAVTSWTKPAFSSIYTSMLPSHHGATTVRDRLPDQVTTMAEYFKEAGFRTAGFVSHSYLDESHGLAQGFDEYTRINKVGDPHASVTSNELSDLAISWLDGNSQDKDKPFFLLLHYFDPHFRFVHHPEFSQTEGYSGALQSNMSIAALFKGRKTFTPEDVEYLKGLYREEIAFTDNQVGRVIDHLRGLGIEKNTLIILTADHGEEFMEHKSLTHGRTIYDEVLRIPLIFYLPGKIEPSIFEAPVDQLDFLPTVLDLACTHVPNELWEGRSLARLITGKGSAPAPRDLFSEISYVSLKGNKITPDYIAVRSGKYKILINRRRKTTVLFDLEKDPGEQADLHLDLPEVTEQLTKKVKFLDDLHAAQERQLAHGGKGKGVALSEEEVKKLKSLGYF